MTEQQINAHKLLAAAILAQAITDLGLRAERRRAWRWLISPDHKKMRELWLGWLGMNDGGFQKLLQQKTFQGQENRALKRIHGEFEKRRGD